MAWYGTERDMKWDQRIGIGNDRDSKDWNFGQNYLEWTLTKQKQKK